MNTSTSSLPLTVSIYDWTADFQSHLFNRKPRLDADSIDLARQHLRVFARWYAAKFNQAFDPSGLTNYDLHLYRSHSLDVEKVKAATWNSRLWALTILCNWIGEPSLLDDIEAKSHVRGSTKHRALTADEYHRLIHTLEQNTRHAKALYEQRELSLCKYMDAAREHAGCLLLLHGLRVDEVANVELSDITLNERSGDVLVRSGKGDKERIVPLNLIARKALASWTTVRPATVPNNLFSVSVRTWQRSVEALGVQIGVPDVTPHWLRYTFAKRLEGDGIPLESIRDLLGHESIETTRRYLRSSLDELQSAVERVM